MFEDDPVGTERITHPSAPCLCITYGEEVAFLLVDLATGTERLLAFEEAYVFRCELRLLQFAQQTPGSAHCGTPWEDCLSHLVRRYVRARPIAGPGNKSP